MTCAWLSRLKWLASPSRLGLRRSTYGPDLQAILDPHRDFLTHFFRNPWRIRESEQIVGAKFRGLLTSATGRPARR